MMFRSQVAPILILEEQRDFASGKLVEIYQKQERQLPEFLRFSSVNCPPGFEFLLDVPGVVVQKEKMCCQSCSRNFEIKDKSGDRFLDASPGTCTCGFVMTGTKNSQQLLYTKRPFFIMDMCDNGMRVEAPQGNLLGYVTVRLDEACCKCKSTKCCNGCQGECCDCLCLKCRGIITQPHFFIMDPMRQVLMTINVEKKVFCPFCAVYCMDTPFAACLVCPDCSAGCCKDVVYILRANDDKLMGTGTVIGEIRNKYLGCGICPEPQRYEITFPEDLEIRMKVVVMSSVFLLNVLLY